MSSDKLAFNQRKATVAEVKASLKLTGHPIPEDWDKPEVISGLGIYDTKRQVLTSWVIDCDGQGPGR